MIVIMHPEVVPAQVELVEHRLHAMGVEAHVSRGVERTVIGVIGDQAKVDKATLRALPGVEDVVPVMKPYKLVARSYHRERTVLDIKGVRLGGAQVQVIGGPCSVETPAQMAASAAGVAAAGCRLMRGGAFKPRTSPYVFQGLGVEGLDLLQTAARAANLPVVTELMDVRTLGAFLERGVDVIQIGARNMQNFDLLREVGRTRTPVILKRGLSATVAEWLMAAEHIAAAGNPNIIFCERGVRSFETAYRNMLDVSAVPVLQRETHLPVIVDPSHAGGKAWMVPALARAALAAGADGLMIEMHPTPTEAWSDADQALTPKELAELMRSLRGIAAAMGRELEVARPPRAEAGAERGAAA